MCSASHSIVSEKRCDGMTGIWIARLQNLKRKPLLLISMTLMTVVMAYVLGSSSNGTTNIYVALDESGKSQEVWKELNEVEGYTFHKMTKNELLLKVNEDMDTIGVLINEDTYSVFAGTESDTVRSLSLAIESKYNELAFKDQVIQASGESTWVEIEKSIEENEAFQVKMDAMDASQIFRYDNALQGLFGFMLFFVFYTISINVQFILEDKQTGIWNRLKLASVSRFQLYFGHLSFSYVIGFMQILLVISMFRYILGVNMYGGFWKVVVISAFYVLLVMAISVFIISLVKTVSQSSVIISLLAVAFAMIGGAYWPLEIVESEVMLVLKWISPVFYAMEALKRVTIYEETFSSVWTYLSMMVGLAVIMLVVGITLLEKRTERYHSSE